MSDPVIIAENLGKRYSLRHQRTEPYTALRDVLSDKARNLFRKRRGPDPTREEFWALKGVSFAVEKGKVVGIIGRNGAGKSTLLKILSRITEPTEGRVRIRGRVASLLEVGTGFHPELTGRENIFLNGAILGMSRMEIKAKFDEIVAFAEVERFLDTPVKRYSSGMYVRLAFAVAAHLEPEILIVDEVLAVGDLQFQKKCLGKMGEVAKGGGRTVLFVSHSVSAIRTLCSSTLWIDKGSIKEAGETQAVVAAYTQELHSNSSQAIVPAAPSDSIVRSVRLTDENGEYTTRLLMGRKAAIEIGISPPRALNQPMVGIGFNTEEGERIFTVHTNFARQPIAAITGDCTVVCSIDQVRLLPGQYHLKVAVGNNNQNIQVDDYATSFQVLEDDVFGSGYTPTKGQGFVIQESNWDVRQWKNSRDR